jgi:hypothetical protein
MSVPSTTKWDVCVTRIDDKLNLGLDFFDACKAMIDLPHRTVTINGEQIRAPSVEGTDIQVSRAVLTKGVALPPNSITSLAVKINPNTKSQLLVIWEGTSFSCSYVKLSFTWRTSYLSNSFGQSIISSWPTHFPFFSLVKHPESLIKFMVQNSPFPTTLDIKIGNDEQADSHK